MLDLSTTHYKLSFEVSYVIINPGHLQILAIKKMLCMSDFECL